MRRAGQKYLVASTPRLNPLFSAHVGGPLPKCNYNDAVRTAENQLLSVLHVRFIISLGPPTLILICCCCNFSWQVQIKVLEQADVSKTIVIYEQQLVLARNEERGTRNQELGTRKGIPRLFELINRRANQSPGGAKLRRSNTVTKLQWGVVGGTMKFSRVSQMEYDVYLNVCLYMGMSCLFKL